MSEHWDELTEEEQIALGYKQEMAALGVDPDSITGAGSNNSEAVETKTKYADGSEVTVKNANTPSSREKTSKQFIQDVKLQAAQDVEKEKAKLADDAFAKSEEEGKVYGDSIAAIKDMQRANGNLPGANDVATQEAIQAQENHQAIMDSMSAQDALQPQGDAFGPSIVGTPAMFPEEERVVTQGTQGAYESTYTAPKTEAEIAAANEAARKRRVIKDLNDPNKAVQKYQRRNSKTGNTTRYDFEGYTEDSKGNLVPGEVTSSTRDTNIPSISKEESQEAIKRLYKDETQKALVEKILSKKQNAKDLIEQEEALKVQIGEGPTKDLMKIAFAALFGGGRGALRAYGRDEERKKKQADKMAEIEQKAINKQNSDQTKAYAKLTKESRKRSEANKKSLMATVDKMLAEGGLKGGGNIKKFSGATRGLASTLMNRGYDFGDWNLRENFLESVSAGVKDSKGWSWDSDTAKGSIEGHFFERMGIMTKDGMISTDSNDLNQSKPKQRSAYSRMMFKKSNPKEWSQGWHNKFRSAKEAAGGEDGDWMWKNNFAGWTLDRINKKQAEAEKAMNK